MLFSNMITNCDIPRQRDEKIERIEIRFVLCGSAETISALYAYSLDESE